jgi:euchromatic histone-lysine N-methyltransferase
LLAFCLLLTLVYRAPGLPRDLEVFKTREKGWGVRCWHKIYAGDYISEYVGEILTIEDSEERENDEYFFDCRVIPAAARNDHLYSMTDGDSTRLNESGSEFLIDGRVRGNVTRYINHSCDPNLIVQCVFVGSERLPRICLFAWKDIQPGEELCYDYAQEQNSDAAPFQCHCGAPTCKGQNRNQGSCAASAAPARASASAGAVEAHAVGAVNVSAPDPQR